MGFLSKIEAAGKGPFLWATHAGGIWVVKDGEGSLLGMVHQVRCKDPSQKAFQTWTDTGSHDKDWPLGTYGELEEAKRELENHLKKEP
jgi:hypothetical protein